MTLSIAFFSSFAQAFPPETSPPIEEPLGLFDCSMPTPNRSDGKWGYPGRDKIINSNRLAMPAGKPLPAEGQIVYLMGRVYDSNCVPIKGAKLELWQTDANGKYRYASPAELVSPAPVFAGSGKTYSNNMGEYQFITLFPGAYSNRAPHLHLKISHEAFPNIETEVFFEGDRRNAKDPNLRRFRDSLKERVTAQVRSAGTQNGLIAHFDVILKGKSKFRQF